MGILMAVLLFLGSSLPAHNLGAGAEKTRPLMNSGAKALNNLTILQTEQHLGGHGQQSTKDAETARMKSQNPSVRLFEDLGKLHIELMLDGFDIRPIWTQANAAFSIICQFEIGEDGHPMHLLSLAGERYIYPKAADACLSKWTLAGLEVWKEYILVLNWEHSLGYASMSILSDQMSLLIKLQKDRIIP